MDKFVVLDVVVVGLFSFLIILVKSIIFFYLKMDKYGWDYLILRKCRLFKINKLEVLVIYKFVNLNFFRRMFL